MKTVHSSQSSGKVCCVDRLKRKGKKQKLWRDKHTEKDRQTNRKRKNKPNKKIFRNMHTEK